MINKWIYIRLFYLICFGILFVGCITNNKGPNRVIFNKIYECDSLSYYNSDFIVDKDSSVYSLQEKTPFEFKLIIDSKYLVTKNGKFNYLYGGINIDTIGLISLDDDKFMFLDNITSNPLMLFDFKARINNSWNIKKGYFNGYEITLTERKYNNVLNDSVYYYDFNYTKTKFPNGYYFVQFEVSPKIGIIGFTFDNGINCSSVITSASIAPAL